MSDIITREQLLAIMPLADSRSDSFLGPLNACMAQYEINTAARIAAFIAQAAHESAQLTRLQENLNYSANGLLATWPKRFSAQEAASYAHQPERIANKVYAMRMGNSYELSGDGWKFRGRGIFQITGRANYRHAAMDLMLPLEDQPDMLLDPYYATLAACWFWHDRNLNRYADTGDMHAITLLINGGTNGLEDRLAFYQTAERALA